jgi:hypothetical protein
MPKVLVKYYAKLDNVKITFFLAYMPVMHELIHVLLDSKNMVQSMVENLAGEGAESFSSAYGREYSGSYKFLLQNQLRSIEL